MSPSETGQTSYEQLLPFLSKLEYGRPEESEFHSLYKYWSVALLKEEWLGNKMATHTFLLYIMQYQDYYIVNAQETKLFMVPTEYIFNQKSL